MTIKLQIFFSLNPILVLTFGNNLPLTNNYQMIFNKSMTLTQELLPSSRKLKKGWSLFSK